MLIKNISESCNTQTHTHYFPVCSLLKMRHSLLQIEDGEKNVKKIIMKLTHGLRKNPWKKKTRQNETIFSHLRILDASSKGKNRNLSMPHYLPKLLSANGVKGMVIWIFLHGHLQSFILWKTPEEKQVKMQLIMTHTSICKHSINTCHKEMKVRSGELCDEAQCV